jgi:YidC/Oxa1 family membrane protein insertase
MEERRLLVAVALSLLVLTVYTQVFSPAPKPTGPQPEVTPAPSASPPPEEAAGAGAGRPAAAEAAAQESAPRPAVVAAERERRVEVVAQDFSVAFSNRGAGLISWTLARFRDKTDHPEEMVPVSSGGMRPLDIETGDEGVDATLRDALFVPSADRVEVSGGGAHALRFAYSDGTIEADKTLVFHQAGLVEVTAGVRRNGKPIATRLVWGPGVGNPSREEREVQGYREPQGVALGTRGVERLVAAKLPPTGRDLSDVRWVGVESHYFAALFVPPNATDARVKPVEMPRRGDEKAVVAPVVLVPVSDSQPTLLYVGAKDYRTLAREGHDLQRVVPVGDWIGPIVVLLMRLLRWVQGHVGNWGWSIVLLTVLINVVMAPFRHYSIANGLKMAKLSPEMKVIQERYRKVPLMDPRRQKMQEEVQALYAKHGMSMTSQMTVGCLPLLLTMPFLFAFYRVLSVSVELRGAPFLWIPDLAQKDPLFLTPVLMGISMFAMQKMTPSTLDPAQQRIMMLMPLMLTGMFLWAPAGLNLYWLTSNLWSVGQQLVEMRVLRPAGAGRGGRERRTK